MNSAPVSPLRQRMIEDMTIRQFGPKTQHDYVRVVADFARFLGRSPDRAEPEDLRRYQLHLAAEGASPGKMNLAVSALRFFCKVTLGRPAFGERLATVRQGERLPVVLSPEEVALLLHCAPGLKHKAALSVAYGCGLRASEIVHLKVSDIDSSRMLIRVEQGKGRKDRYVMLAPDLLNCCVPGGGRPGRGAGCSPAAIRPSRSPPASSIVPAMSRRPPRRSTSGSRCTPCGTPSPPICSSARPTSASSRCCSKQTTYCPPTPDRGADLLSVPSPLWRDRAHCQAVRLPRRRGGRHSAARWVGRLHSRLDDARSGSASPASC